MGQMEKQLQGYRLMLCEIVYRRPDHQSLLQSYMWQDYDLPPKFPVIFKFLKFWENNIDGPLHSVFISSNELIKPVKLSFSTEVMVS